MKFQLLSPCQYQKFSIQNVNRWPNNNQKKKPAWIYKKIYKKMPKDKHEILNFAFNKNITKNKKNITKPRTFHEW